MQYVNRKNEMESNLDGLKSTCSLTELVLKGKDIELLLLKKQVQEKLSVMADVELKDLPRSVGKQICFIPGVLDLGRLEDPDMLLEKKKGQLGLEENRKITLPNMVFGQRDRDRDIMEEAGKVIPKRTVEAQTDVQTSAPSGAASFMNRCVQTEYPERYDREDSSTCSSTCGSFGLETRGTETDVISTVEKAVNTRSKGLQAVSGQMQRGDSKDDSPTAFAEGGTGMESPATRRQRRRRERAKAADGSGKPGTSGNPEGATEGYGSWY